MGVSMGTEAFAPQKGTESASAGTCSAAPMTLSPRQKDLIITRLAYICELPRLVPVYESLPTLGLTVGTLSPYFSQIIFSRPGRRVHRPPARACANRRGQRPDCSRITPARARCSGATPRQHHRPRLYRRC